ncbi:MAG: iron-sulfur cluster assembly protein [Kangiellaceae bacterium]|jgi:iron-sulfur cluster assembly protein
MCNKIKKDNNMAITVTEAAASRARSFMENRGCGVGLRLGVKTTGCSGLAYVLEFVDELKEEDNVFEDKGVKIIIDTKSLNYLDGTELDFAKEGLNEGFQFNNPNVNGECGCGESFTV